MIRKCMGDRKKWLGFRPTEPQAADRIFMIVRHRRETLDTQIDLHVTRRRFKGVDMSKFSEPELFRHYRDIHLYKWERIAN